MRHGKLVGSIQQPIEGGESEAEQGEGGKIERKQEGGSKNP